MTPVLLAAGTGPSDHGIATPVSLILIAAAAFLIPLMAGRIKTPAVVLEILFGVAVGPVLGIIEPGEELLGFLSEFGLFLVMFLAGFEIDFGRLERQGPTQLLSGLTLFGLFLAAGWIGAGLLESAADRRLFLTFLIAAAALGLVVPALRETGRAATRLGQLILITGVFAEVGSLVGIIILGEVADGSVGIGVLALPVLLGVVGVTLVVLRRIAWWHPERFERLFRADDPAEMGIRATLALLFVFVGLATLLEVEPILGAFLAGALFAFVFRDPGQLQEQLNGFSFGFFIPVFFINVGIEFPLSELADRRVLGQAMALIGIAFAIKLIPSLLLMLRRFSLRESLAAGILLAGQLSVIIALADLGLELGLLSSGLRAGAIMLVAVSAIISPVGFGFLAPPLRNEQSDRRRRRLLGDR